MTCADPDVCVRDGERGLFRVCDDDDEEPAAAGVLAVAKTYTTALHTAL